MASTPSLNITPQDNEYNYKKTLGVSYLYPSYSPDQEPYSSLPFIFNSQIMTNTVPLQAPVFDSSSVVIGPSGGSGGTGIKYTSSTYPYIVKYENLPLTSFTIGASNKNYAYTYNSTQDPSDNLTIQAIPPDFDPNRSYVIGIFAYNTSTLNFESVSSGTGSNTWIFDCTTGYVTFTYQAWTDSFNTGTNYDNYPYISFYRYEGPFGLDSSGSSQWTTTGTDIYYNSGNVGIGTASPAYPLDVNGNSRFTGQVGINKTPTSTNVLDVSGSVLISGGSNAIFNTQVGIYRSPQSTYSLDVSGSTRIISGTLSVNRGLISGHSLDVSGISRFEGPVGIYRSPQSTYSLDVSGGTRIENGLLSVNMNPVTGDSLDVSGISRFIGEVGINKKPQFAYVLDVSGDVFITGSKAVFYAPLGINITPVSPYSLDVSGSVYISGDLTALTCTTTSDYRMKKDIRNIDENFNVDNLNPVIYRLKNNDQIQTGFIAHELQEYYPFLVNGEKDGKNMQSINYSGLIPILVKEIQELKRQINILKNK